MNIYLKSIGFKQNMFGSHWCSSALKFCGAQCCCICRRAASLNRTNSRARVKITVAQSVGSKVLGVYWQEKIIERRSTNEARMAALINVTLFARRSILNVIYLNESVCSRKLGIHPAGRLACRCVPPPSTGVRVTNCKHTYFLKQGGTITQWLRLFAQTD